MLSHFIWLFNWHKPAIGKTLTGNTFPGTSKNISTIIMHGHFREHHMWWQLRTIQACAIFVLSQNKEQYVLRMFRCDMSIDTLISEHISIQQPTLLFLNFLRASLKLISSWHSQLCSLQKIDNILIKVPISRCRRHSQYFCSRNPVTIVISYLSVFVSEQDVALISYRKIEKDINLYRNTHLIRAIKVIQRIISWRRLVWFAGAFDVDHITVDSLHNSEY